MTGFHDGFSKLDLSFLAVFLTGNLFVFNLALILD